MQYSGGSYKALETEKDLIATVTTKTEYTADTIWGGVTSKTTRTVDFTWREGNERVTLTGSEVRALGTWYGPVPECDVYASAKKGNTAKATITATTYLNGIDNENLNAVNLVEYTDYGMGMADQLLFYSIRQKSQRCTKKGPFTFCTDGRIFVSFTKRLC